MSNKFTELLKESRDECLDIIFKTILYPLSYIFLPKTLWYKFVKSSWGKIVYGILDRQVTPFFSAPKIVLYLLFFILVVGGIGPWVTFIEAYFSEPHNYNPFFQSLSTFSLSLIATSIGEMILSKRSNKILSSHNNNEDNEDNSDLDEKHTLFQDIDFFYFCIAILAAILCSIGVLNGKCYIPIDYSINASFWGTIMAIFLWWQINSTDSKWTPPRDLANIYQQLNNEDSSQNDISLKI